MYWQYTTAPAWLVLATVPTIANEALNAIPARVNDVIDRGNFTRIS